MLSLAKGCVNKVRGTEQVHTADVQIGVSEYSTRNSRILIKDTKIRYP